MAKRNPIDKWIKSELKKELKKVPLGIRTMARTNLNAQEVVCSSISRKVGLNPKSKSVKKICRGLFT